MKLDELIHSYNELYENTIRPSQSPKVGPIIKNGIILLVLMALYVSFKTKDKAFLGVLTIIAIIYCLYVTLRKLYQYTLYKGLQKKKLAEIRQKIDEAQEQKL